VYTILSLVRLCCTLRELNICTYLESHKNIVHILINNNNNCYFDTSATMRWFQIVTQHNNKWLSSVIYFSSKQNMISIYLIARANNSDRAYNARDRQKSNFCNKRNIFFFVQMVIYSSDLYIYVIVKYIFARGLQYYLLGSVEIIFI